MIYLGYLGESKKIEFSEKVKKYLIVRRPVNGIPKGFIHLPEISPSNQLFKNTQRWKSDDYTLEELNKLKESNILRTDDYAWWYFYKPRFKEELKEETAKKAIDRIFTDIKEGYDVWLFCYCKNLEQCHRVLVGKYLEKIGFEVNFREVQKIDEDYQLKLF